MRAKAITAVLALGVVAGLVLPGGALATGRHYEQKAQVDVLLNLPGSNGFDLTLFTLSGRAVAISTSKSLSRSASESVSYSSTGHSARSGFQGRALNVEIGRLGHFRGHFVAKSIKSQKPQHGCTGEPTVDEEGVFIGSFVFHGERGYTTVHASRARGYVFRSGTQRCVETSSKRHPGREKARRAREKRDREGEFRLLAGNERGTQVQVNRQKGRGGSDVVTTSASTNERFGTLSISRSASVSAPGTGAASILQIPNLAEPLAEAPLQPPAPFSGSATFSSTSPKSASWTGDLAVDLPGAPRLPLTGDGIAAGACQGTSDCTKTLPKFLQIAARRSHRRGDGPRLLRRHHCLRPPLKRGSKLKIRFPLALAAVVFLLLPAHAPAAAKPGGGRGRSKVTQGLAAQGTNGFQIHVQVVNGRELSLSASRIGAGLAISAAEYTLPLRRKLEPGEIVAGLGHLGRIDVHFVPKEAKKSKAPESCAGEAIVTEEGHYIGFFSFHGERGFTRVESHRSPGAIVTEPLGKCGKKVTPVEQRRHKLLKLVTSKKTKAEEGSAGIETVELHASGTNPTTTFKATRLAELKATGGSSFAFTNFLVTAERRLGRIEEKGVAAVLFGEGSWLRPLAPLTPKSDLLVEPPAPFTGSAHYRQETPSRGHWSGDLKVDMPGFGLLPLAGPRNRATASVKKKAAG